MMTKKPPAAPKPAPLTDLSFAVIGDPIAHSLSPFIHNFLYQIYDLSADYQAIKVAKGRLKEDFWPLLLNKRLHGFNVTMPHKKDIIPFLEQLSEESRLIESVNTVIRTPQGLKGFSTDGAGFLRSLAAQGLQKKGGKAVLFGSGGAAAALTLAWSRQMQAPLTIIARSPQKAQAFLAKIPQQQAKVQLLPWEKEYFSQALCDATLLVNTTPLGMQGKAADFSDFNDFSFLTQLAPQALVYDLIYQPRQTTLLQKASALGYRTLNGIDMLIYQALEAFTLMTGQTTSDHDKEVIVRALTDQGLI